MCGSEHMVTVGQMSTRRDSRSFLGSCCGLCKLSTEQWPLKRNLQHVESESGHTYSKYVKVNPYFLITFHWQSLQIRGTGNPDNSHVLKTFPYVHLTLLLKHQKQ